MAYRIKELFYSLQGEGARAGSAAVFVRFAGCNLWSGRPADRSRAECPFCDTDFRGTDGLRGGSYATPEALAGAVRALWPEEAGDGPPRVILTGGEPLLQLDAPLIAALKRTGCELALETNGTLPLPPGLDWVCVSPKVLSRTVVRAGDELKLVYPQAHLAPEACAAWAFGHFFLQPMDGPHRAEHTRAAEAYCLAHPQWRLSLQLQKLTGLQARENVLQRMAVHDFRCTTHAVRAD